MYSLILYAYSDMLHFLQSLYLGSAKGSSHKLGFKYGHLCDRRRVWLRFDALLCVSCAQLCSQPLPTRQVHSHWFPLSHVSLPQTISSLTDGSSHLSIHQALERHHCHKACWSLPEPASEAAVQPSLSTTIWLMSCQSLSRGWPSPKPRGNQSLLVWTLNYSPLLKPWDPSDRFFWGPGILS